VGPSAGEATLALPCASGATPLRESTASWAKGHRVHGEPAGGIAPYRERAPAGALRERPERANRVFVAVLGLDGLAARKLESVPADRHLLRRAADEMHLDARAWGIEEGPVLEGIYVEIAAELAIDAGEEIEIEARGHAGRII